MLSCREGTNETVGDDKEGGVVGKSQRRDWRRVQDVEVVML